MTEVLAQPANTYKRYWIQFKDKTGSPYSVNEPSQFLSPKAIERRNKQGIAIVENDLPVNPSYVAQVTAIAGVEVVNRSKWFNAITIQTTDSLAAVAVSNLPFVLQSQQTGKRKKPTNSDYFLNDLSKLIAEAQAKDAAKLNPKAIK